MKERGKETRKFPLYGYVSIIVLLFMQLNFYLKIQPFADWYFPIIWGAYVVTVDAFVLKLRGDSLIRNRFSSFLGMVVISALFWFVFEFTNLVLKNWYYTGLEGIAGRGGGGIALLNLFGMLSFATVLPALFETTELYRSMGVFERVSMKKGLHVTRKLLSVMLFFGIISFLLAMVFPSFAFPLIWLAFFLILDPINHINGQPSIIRHLKDRELAVPLTLLLAGITLGFLWEFWNFWAIPKWTYDIPYLGFGKIFEMPVLGYLGYLPFAWELYAMYWFVRHLFEKEEKLLSD